MKTYLIIEESFILPNSIGIPGIFPIIGRRRLLAIPAAVVEEGTVVAIARIGPIVWVVRVRVRIAIVRRRVRWIRVPLPAIVLSHSYHNT